MTLLEALSRDDVLRGDMWFRPVGWRGSNMAYMVDCGNTVFVPDLRGGTTATMTYNVRRLTGEWEVVDPAKVCEE